MAKEKRRPDVGLNVVDFVKYMRESVIGLGYPHMARQRLLWLIEAARTGLGELLAEDLAQAAAAAIEAGKLDTVGGKQDFAKEVNARLKRDGLVIDHPETHEPCVLTAVADDYNGKFCLESRVTRKRSRCTKDLSSLLPITILPEPRASDEEPD